MTRSTSPVRLTDSEDGFAKVRAQLPGRDRESLLGTVVREKHGSGRTSVAWYATTTAGHGLGFGRTRAEAVAMLAARFGVTA